MKSIHDIVAVVAAAAIGTSGAYVAGGATVSVTPLNLSLQGETVAATQPAAESDTVKVQGRGVGVDKTTALKDAYRDAIERAVGLYVDAETVVNNDQVVKDQILTQSNAYITDYRELNTERIDVGFEVRILATVKKQALTTKLTGVMPAQTVRIDNTGLQNVHAQLVTKEKRAEDAAALLKNALDGLNPMKSLMVASIRPETARVQVGDAVRVNKGSLPANQVMLRYLFEVKFDRAKYFSEFVPHLKKVLDQISLTQPKTIRLSELMPSSGQYANRNRSETLQEYLTTGALSNCNQTDSYAGNRTFGHRDGYYVYLDPVHVYSISWQGDNWIWPFRDCQYRPKTAGSFSWKDMNLTWEGFDKNYPKDKVYFALITSLNADCSNGKVTLYALDKSVIDVLNEWRKGLIDKEGVYNGQKTTNYNIVLLDKAGEEIGVYPWQIPNGILMNVKFAEIPNAGMVYAAPFVGCFGEKLIEWRDFVLEKDQLTKVATIKIERVD